MNVKRQHKIQLGIWHATQQKDQLNYFLLFLVFVHIHHKAGNYEELIKRQYQATEKLANMYAQSRFHSHTRAKLDQLLGQQQLDRNSAVETTFVTPFWNQLMWITYRSFKNVWGFLLVTGKQVIWWIILNVLWKTQLGTIYVCVSDFWVTLAFCYCPCVCCSTVLAV